MGNYELLKAAINEVIKANGRQEITGEVLNQVLLSMVNSLGAGYQCMGVATPSTNPGTPDQNVFYFATQAGTYTNFDAIVLQAGISVLIWDGDWASQTWFAIDSTPTNNSQNLIASGAVFNALKLDGCAYDVTAHNSGATFASLSALLNSENLNTLIPTEIRHGGMSIKFVQSSDNKYVQFRYMGTDVTGTPNPFIDTANWQNCSSDIKTAYPIILTNVPSNSIGVDGEFAAVAISVMNHRVYKKTNGVWAVFTDYNELYLNVGGIVLYKADNNNSTAFVALEPRKVTAIQANDVPSSNDGIDGNYCLVNSCKVFYKSSGNWMDVTSDPLFTNKVQYFVNDTTKYVYNLGIFRLYDERALMLDGILYNGTFERNGRGVKWEPYIILEIEVGKRLPTINLSVGTFNIPNGYDMSLYIELLDNSQSRLSMSQIYENSNNFVSAITGTAYMRVWGYLSFDADSSTEKYTINGLSIHCDNSLYELEQKTNEIDENLKSVSGFVFNDTIEEKGNGSTYNYASKRIILKNISGYDIYSCYFGKIGSTTIGANTQQMCINVRYYDENHQMLQNWSYKELSNIYLDLYSAVKTVEITPVITFDQHSTLNANYYFNNIIVYRHDAGKNNWFNSTISCYGDSVTAICNGDFNYPFSDINFKNTWNWMLRIARFHSFTKAFGRGVGGQCFAFGAHGGSVAWVDEVTGEYVNRNDNYNYDNYEGNVEIPEGCVAIRGSLSSWLRITKMYPASIKDSIDVILLQSHNDASQTSDLESEPDFIENDTTDTEWAASSYYSTYGGDYNINTLKGGIASTIMKLQAWMPQAKIVLLTPISGRGTQSQLNKELSDTNMQKVQVAVKDIHNLMSIPCIDVYGNCGINGLNRTTYITDTIHPYNQYGSARIASAINGELNRISNYKLSS